MCRHKFQSQWPRTRSTKSTTNSKRHRPSASEYRSHWRPRSHRTKFQILERATMGRISRVRCRQLRPPLPPIVPPMPIWMCSHCSIETHSTEIGRPTPINTINPISWTPTPTIDTMHNRQMGSVTFCRDNITKNGIVIRKIVTAVLATSIRLAFDVSSTIRRLPTVDSKYEKIIDMLVSMRIHTIRSKRRTKNGAYAACRRSNDNKEYN